MPYSEGVNHVPRTMATLSDLVAYCRQQARIERCDYDANKYWQADIRTRNKAFQLCLREFSGRLSRGTEELIPGNYQRLTIHADGTPEYTVGQYAPTEIYDYLHWYLRQTNSI
jgi:hypothetical protein